jgi:ribosomal protein S27AE
MAKKAPKVEAKKAPEKKKKPRQARCGKCGVMNAGHNARTCGRE